MKKPIFKGTCTALVTPFNDDGSVDYVSFKKLIEFQIDKVSALLFLGTTGEASTLSIDEKRQITTFAVKQVAKRLPIIIGIGGNNPSAIIEFGKTLKAIDGVLLSSPYYNKATQAGLVTYFHTIANAIKLPLIAYNVPARTGQNIQPATFAEICKNKYISGIKEASGDINQVAEVIRLCNKPVYCGDDALSFPALALGALGVISVASNVIPYTTLTRKLYYKYLPLFKALFVEVNPIPVKYVLSQMGLIKNNLRLPLTPLDKKWYSSLCLSHFQANT